MRRGLLQRSINTKVDWRLYLPQSSFPMRANAVTREPELRHVCTQQVYAVQQQNGGDRFVLHDGPPYANGPPHLGHALNKVLKDIINRFHASRGRRVSYIPGWDCHGLPIELKALQSLPPSTREPSDVLKAAAACAQRELQGQMTEFQSWAIMGEWEQRYETMDPAYERAQLEALKLMVSNGRIHEGVKPVWWSPATQTALADAELEYDDNHTSQCVYVAFPFVTQTVTAKALEGRPPALAVAWTTTPWTLPANRALLLHENIRYAYLDCGRDDGALYVVAEARVPDFAAALQLSHTAIVHTTSVSPLLLFPSRCCTRHV